MRPLVFQVGGTLYWVLQTRNPDTMVLKDADSTPTVAVRKNGASVGDSVTVTKRSATTGIYDCSYNPASEVEGDSFTFEESATVTGTTTAQATYAQTWNARVVAVERGTDSAALASGVNVTQIGGDTQSATDLKDFADAGYDPATHKVQGVVLVDTTTTNTDMRGTDSAVLASNYTAPPTTGAIADAVLTESILDHRNVAHSLAKFVWQIRQANLTIDGTVSNAITPTTLTFASDVVATTSAYAHAVLLFTTGPLAGENSPIISYNSTNGVFLLEEALTAAPSDGDEFVVIAGSHVHSVAAIQDGLATSAAVAAEAVKTANILDGVAWILADATGAIAAPQSATATAILTTFGATYTVQYAGLTSTGVRTAPTLSKV